MVDLITLDKNHPDFESYIWGTFSQTKRALPIESLNVNTDHEKITFEIKDISSIQSPDFILKWVTVLKLKNFIWVLLPLLLVLVKNMMDESVGDFYVAGLSAMAAVCLHSAMNLTNDIQDHIRGLDRLYPKSGSRALQNGWVTAKRLQRISYVFIFFGILFGLPGIFLFPEILWIVLPLAAFGVMGLVSYKMGLKYRGWSELVIFLMLGPLLTTGYQLSFGGGFDFEVIFIGILTGWLAVFVIHLKNLEQLIIGSQAQFNNTVTRLGFEKSKKLIGMWWVIFVILLIVYHGVYASVLWLWILAIASVLISFPFLEAVSHAESPLGSKLKTAIFIGNRISQFVIALWVLENIWYYYLIEF